MEWSSGQKEINLQFDAGSEIRMTLSKSGRISLSDIVAATIMENTNVQDGKCDDQIAEDTDFLDQLVSGQKTCFDSTNKIDSDCKLKAKDTTKELNLANTFEQYFKDDKNDSNLSKGCEITTYNSQHLAQTINNDNTDGMCKLSFDSDLETVALSDADLYDDSSNDSVFSAKSEQIQCKNSEGVQKRTESCDLPTSEPSLPIIVRANQRPNLKRKSIDDFQDRSKYQINNSREKVLPTFKSESNLFKMSVTDMITPRNKRTCSLNDSESFSDDQSPISESRFNSSLCSLLGSPPPDSPLSSNPFFSDLQAILLSDCKGSILPKTLIESVSDKPLENVYSRERSLQGKFSTLQERYPEEIRELSSFYKYQSALIETERFRTLHENKYSANYRESLNTHYDNQLHMIMDRVERSVLLLAEAERESSSNRFPLKPRPMLSRRAVRMMEEWYTRHFEHPYPTVAEIDAMATAGDVTTEQVKKWFANKRNRSKNTRTLTDIARKKRQRQLSSRW